MGSKQCKWNTTPPNIAASCNNAMSEGQAIFGETNAEHANTNETGCLNYANCGIALSDDCGPRIRQGKKIAKSAKNPDTTTITDADLLAQRQQIRADITAGHNNTPADYWNIISHNNKTEWNADYVHMVGVGGGCKRAGNDENIINVCVPSMPDASSMSNLSIPAWSNDTDPLSVPMPVANLLYDSTNCGPKTNALSDWKTTDAADILKVIGGAIEKPYVLVPATSDSSGAAASSEDIPAGISYYKKEFNFEWLDRFEYCSQVQEEGACQKRALCKWEDGQCQNGDHTLNLESYPSPSTDQTFPVFSAPLSFDPNQFDNKKHVCLKPNQTYQIEDTCIADYSLYTPSAPSPPIVIDNKTVENFCRNSDPCPAPDSGEGVCYSTNVSDMGAPEIHACIAIPTENAVDPIPSFDVQLECMQHVTQDDCTQGAPTASGYTCSWESLETSNGDCAGLSRLDCEDSQAHPTCSWGTCMTIGDGVCVADTSTHTLVNDQSDPFVWTMWDNFTKSSDAQMSCDSSHCDSTKPAPSTKAPWGIPSICKNSSRGVARQPVPGSSLNGIPFCAHYVDPA